MKIIALSGEHTTSASDIAFVLDEPMSDEVLEHLTMGPLTFTAYGNILKVSLQNEAVFSAQNVEHLNERIGRAVAKVEQLRDRHNRLLQELAQASGLPLA